MNEQWMRRVLFESSSKRSFNKCTTLRSMSLLEVVIQQHTSTVEIRSIKICTILQLQSCWEKCNVKLMRDVHLKTDFVLIIKTIITPFISAQPVISIVASWPSYHGKSHQDPEWWGHFGATRVSGWRITRKEEMRVVLILKDCKFCWKRQQKRIAQPPMMMTIMHLKITTFANLNEFWNFKTEIFG